MADGPGASRKYPVGWAGPVEPNRPTVVGVAKHPTMRTADGRWSVEVITTRGGQSFRVKRLDTVTPVGSGWTPTGQLVATIGEVRELLGDDFETLTEVRDRRFEGGR